MPPGREVRDPPLRRERRPRTLHAGGRSCPHAGPFLSASNDAAPVRARVFLTPLPMSLLAKVVYRKMASYRCTDRQPPERPDRLALATRRGERFGREPAFIFVDAAFRAGKCLDSASCLTAYVPPRPYALF